MTIELLAILIKPIVGVTLVSSGDEFAYGPLGQANEPLHMPANMCAGTGAEPSSGQAGTENALSASTMTNTPGGTQTPYAQHAGLGGSLMAGSLSSVPGLPAGMVNINMMNPSTAGTGAGAFGSSSSPRLGLGALHGGLSATGSTPQQRQYLHERLLQQQQAQQNRRTLHMTQANQSSDGEDRYDNDVEEANAPTEREIALQNQLEEMAAQKAALERQIQEQHQKLLLLAASDGVVPDPPTGKPKLGRQKSKAPGEGPHVHPQVAGLHINIPTSTPHVAAGSSSLAVPTANKTGGSSKARLPTSPILLIDENMLLGGSGLGGRHSLRFKEAIETAQEASGQRLVEVPTSPLTGMTVVPGQIQVSVGHAAGTSGGALARSNSAKRVEQSSHQHHHHLHHHHHLQKLPSHGHEHDSSVRSPVSTNPALHSDMSDNNNDNNRAAGSGDISTMQVPVAVVMPFGTNLVAQAPLPLHLIPTVAQQEQQQKALAQQQQNQQEQDQE